MEARTGRGVDTRTRIERAALKNFVEKGIAETSIRDIAGTAGISLGAMYNHYASKEDLAWDLFIGGWAEIARDLRERIRDHDTLATKLRAMIRYVFARFDEDWEFVTYVFVSRHLHLQRVHPARVNPYTVFRMVIREGMRRGQMPKSDPDLATSLVMGAIIQAIDSRILTRLKGPLRAYADDTAAMCTRMLGAAD